MNLPPIGSPEHQAETVEIASRYTQLGYPVFLFSKKNGQKKPRIPGKGTPNPDPDGWGRGHLSATKDLDEFDAMVSRYPDSYVALAFHTLDACVLDVDPRNGGDQTLASLEAEHGELPRCPRQDSPSGGFHLVYRIPKGVRLRGKLGPGIDVKRNGWIGADPRYGYEWSERLVLPADLPPIPDWALTLLVAPPSQLSAAEITDPDQLQPAIALVAQWWPVPGGEEWGDVYHGAGRHEFASALAGYVITRGLSLVMTLALVEGAARAAGDEEITDRLKAVDSTFQRVRLGEPVVSTSVVKPIAKEDGLEELDRLLGLKRSPARVMLIRHTDEAGRLTAARRREGWWEWRSGLWRPRSGESVENEVWTLLERLSVGDESEPGPSIKRVSEVIREFRSLGGVSLPDDREAPWWVDGQDRGIGVAVANGILNLETGEVIPSDPRLFNTTQIPVDYREDEQVGGDRWLRLLDDQWAGDGESIETLQKWLGSHLDPWPWRLQKAMLFVGEKRSGKGTIMRVMESVFGKDQCAGADLSSFGESFGLQPLLDKRAILVADARLTSTPSRLIERILTLTAGDPVQVNRKHKEQLSCRLGARLTMATNPPVPRLNDISGAVASRFIVLNFANSFFGREDPKLAEELEKELPQILRWIVEGWRILVCDGYKISTPKSAAGEAEALYQATSDVRGFIQERVYPGTEKDFVGTDTLWQAWNGWANQNGVRVGTKRQFSEDFHAACGFSRRAKRDPGIRGFSGITLKSG